MALPLLGIELAVWVTVMGVLIFCILCVYITKALFGVAGGTLGKLPVIGGWINSGLHVIEHRIVSVMSAAASGAQSLAGLALHIMAREVDWIGREIKNHANLIGLLAALTFGSMTAREILLLIRSLRALIHANEGTATHALHRVIGAEKRIQHGIGEDVLPRIKSLEREYGQVIEHDIGSLRARAKTLEREYDRIWKWTRANGRAWGTLAFAGAVALALKRLGLGWLRCNSLSKLGRRVGCGGWALLDDLLAGVIDVLVIADLCQLTKLLIDVAESAEVQAVISGIITGMDELLLCQGVTRPAALSGYWTDPPPAQPFAALPAL